jgi:ABC-type multidrug transport system ATPase subunit
VAEVAGAASIQLSDFTPQHLISDRHDARVYQVRHPRTGEQLALKVWRRASHLLTAQQRAGFIEQVAWLDAVSRDTGRIVRCHEAGLDGFPWVAMDLCDGSLARTGGQEGVGVNLVRDGADALLTVLRRLLRDGKTHGRLTPSDLLITRGRIVLGVFGLLPDPGSGRTAGPGQENDLATIAAVVLDLLPDRIPPQVQQALADIALRPPGAPVDEDIVTFRKLLGLAPERVSPKNPTPEKFTATSSRRVSELPEPATSSVPLRPSPSPSPSPEARPAPVAPPAPAARPAPAAQPPPASAGSAVEQVRVPTADRPGLLVSVAGQEYHLSPGTEVIIGRAPNTQIRVLDPLVSRQHARVHDGEEGWRITDFGSTNGVWQDGLRIGHAKVGPTPLRVRVGSPRGPEIVLSRQQDSAIPASVRVLGPEPLPSGEPAPDVEGTTSLDSIPPSSQLPEDAGATRGEYDVPLGTLMIGRDLDCGLVLDDLLISGQHAELRRLEDRTILVDQHSANGTFVNGDRVRHRRIAPGDLIGLGGRTLRFEGTRLIEMDGTDGAEFGAHGLSILVDGARLLSGVSFRLPPRSLLAVVGPAGTGKSTLLDALAGLRPVTAGQVLYGGRDLYRNYGELRQRIGYLPRQSILHPGLTLEQELKYRAQLRLPPESSAEEQSDRIDDVARQLDLTARLDTRTEQLDDGERIRAAVAMELLTDPSVLILDEPASGSDVALDREVMQRLRRLADDGHTVVMATSHLEHLSVCDVVLVLAPGGQVAFLGPSDEAIEYFRTRNWADVFTVVKENPPGRLASYFWQSQGRDPRSYPSKPLDELAGTALAGELPALPSRPSFGGQLRTLIRRRLSLLAADRGQLGLLVLLPVAIALISRGIPSGFSSADGSENTGAGTILLVLIMGAALTGTFLALRVLATEHAVYLRERTVGVSWAAYLWSTVVLLSVIGVLQAVVMTVLALIGRDPPEGLVITSWWMFEIGLAIAAVTVASGAVGLVISALIRKKSQGTPLFVLFSVGQFVGSGGVIPVAGSPGLEQLAWFMPARWAFAAAAATVDLQLLQPELPSDSHWNHTFLTWRGDMILVFLLGAVFLAVAAVLNRRMDPRRPQEPSPTSQGRTWAGREANAGRWRPKGDASSDDIVADSS